MNLDEESPVMCRGSSHRLATCPISKSIYLDAELLVVCGLLYNTCMATWLHVFSNMP